MIYFLFGFCFCISLDRIIGWVRDYTSYDHRRNNRSYPRYRSYDENWRIYIIKNRLSDLETQWYEFKEKYPDMFEQDEESEEEV